MELKTFIKVYFLLSNFLMNLYLLESSDFYCKSEFTILNDNWNYYDIDNMRIGCINNSSCTTNNANLGWGYNANDFINKLKNNIKCYKSFEINTFENLYTIILVNLFTCIFYF